MTSANHPHNPHTQTLYITIKDSTTNSTLEGLNKTDISNILSHYIHYETLPDELVPEDLELKDAVDKNGGVIPLDQFHIRADLSVHESDILRVHKMKGTDQLAVDIQEDSKGVRALRRLTEGREETKLKVGNHNWALSVREVFVWAVAKHFPRLGGEKEEGKIKEDIMGSDDKIREVHRLGKSGTWKIKFLGEDFPGHIDLSRYGRKKLERLVGRVQFCKKCLRFNHLKHSCDREKQTCGNCGQEGTCRVSDCTKNRFCIHCNTNQHRTIDINQCPKYLDIKAKHVRKLENRHAQAAHIDLNIQNIRQHSNFQPTPPPFRFSHETYPDLISDSTRQKEQIAHLTRENQQMRKQIDDLMKTKSLPQNNKTQPPKKDLEQTISTVVTETLKSELAELREHIQKIEKRLTDDTKLFKQKIAALQTEITAARKAKSPAPPSPNTPRTRSTMKANRKRRATSSPSGQSDDSHTEGETTNSEPLSLESSMTDMAKSPVT